MDLQEQKESLIKELISFGSLRTKSVMDAFRKVRREEFVLPEYRNHAYINEPLPIMEDQTISQPLTVAEMTEALQPQRGQKILEVGSGSGYQAAILAEIVGKNGKIITTERIKSLFEFAKSNIRKCGYKNVLVVHYDGSKGYEKYSPYDRIIVTASAPDIPSPLINQLKKNGKMVIPIGDELVLIEKDEKGNIKKKFLGYYAFVPLIGEHGHRE